MANATWIPTQWNGNDLTASPFKTTGLGGQRAVFFMAANSPLQTRAMSAVEASVVRRGPQDVRAQPQSAVWELHCRLEDATEAIIESFFKIFDEEQEGQYFLRCDDADSGATNYRVAARVLSVRRHPRHTSYWLVQLRVADPVFEENAESTVTGSLAAMSGDTASQAAVNAGNRLCRPLYQLQIDSAKTDSVDSDPLFIKDFVNFGRGVLANRSQEFWNNFPVNLVETVGPVHVWDTAAIIRDPSRGNKLNESLSDSDTTITVDTSVGGGLRNGIAWCWIDAFGGSGVEQIYYTANAGETSVTGVVRGVGGTTAIAHDNNSPMHQSHMLADGKDVRVYMGAQEVERWLGLVNTANTKVWANLTLPPAIVLTPVTDRSGVGIGEFTPASGGAIEFEEGVEKLPESGLLAIERELIAYSARDVKAKKVTGIERGAWAFGNGAYEPSAHNATGTRCLGNAVPFVIAWEREEVAWNSGAPEPIERQPAFQLNSDNRNWLYGDQATIAGGVFWDPDNPDRTAMFTLDNQPSVEDVNAIRPMTLKTSGDYLGWSPVEVATARPAVARMTLAVPPRIKQAASVVTVDIQSRVFQRMRILLEDRAGVIQELANFHESAATANQDFTEDLDTAQAFTADMIANRISLEGQRAVILGNWPLVDLSDNDIILSAATPSSGVSSLVAQRIVLDQDASIEGVFCRMRKSVGTFTFSLRLYDDTGSAPDAGAIVASFQEAAHGTQNILITSYRDTYYIGSGGTNNRAYEPRRVKAGVYWLIWAIESYSSGDVRIEKSDAETRQDQLYTDDTSSSGGHKAHPGSAARFALLHASGGPIQIDALDFDDDTEGTFDKLAIVLNADVPTETSGEVMFCDWAENTSGYHCNAVLKNTTTGEQIEIDHFMEISATVKLFIDTDLRQVYQTDGNWRWDVPAVITPSDRAEWLGLDADSNTIVWNEDNMADTNVELKYRSRKV